MVVVPVTSGNLQSQKGSNICLGIHVITSWQPLVMKVFVVFFYAVDNAIGVEDGV